jgi:glycosyltransferase involved in cell wall biosynthesis
MKHNAAYDPKYLADKIMEIYNNPQMAETLGKNGQKLVLDKYNVKKEVEKVVKLYQNLKAEISA